jgi:MoxR-like ATPase
MTPATRPYTGLGTKPDRAVSLPPIDFGRATHPSGYRAERELVDAVNVALMLRQPLLVTGEPGTGKTQLAASIAWELGLGKPLRFDTKSTSRARDLFYTYDALGHFQASQNREDRRSAQNFISFNALGLALLLARPREDVDALLPQGFEHDGPRGSVVLVDEIDKAPRDFPNDLLAELEEPRFRVAELGNLPAVEADAVLRPIIILTSNSEKNLPDAFLRRCVYHHIPFPKDGDRLREILASRLGSLAPQDSPLVTSAIELFYVLRGEPCGLAKKPATAELIAWLQALVRAGASPAASLRRQAPFLEGTIGVLVKSSEDMKRANVALGEWMAGPAR